MSKSGGIAYLIKHGRAPSPVATRTKMTGKRYAAGGPPINNSLGYGPEFDYVFEPGGMTLDAAGKPVYHSGKFVRKTATAPAGAGTGIAAIAPATGSGNRSGYEEGGGGGSGWRDTSLADRASYYADNPTEAKIAGGLDDLLSNSMLGRGAGWLMDKLDPAGAQGRRQERMVYDAFRNTPGTDRYGLSDDRFNYGTDAGGGGEAVSVGGDAIDSVGSGEKAAAVNLSNPAVQESIRNSAPEITQAMRDAAIREGGGEVPAPAPAPAPAAKAAPAPAAPQVTVARYFQEEGVPVYQLSDGRYVSTLPSGVSYTPPVTARAFSTEDGVMYQLSDGRTVTSLPAGVAVTGGRYSGTQGWTGSSGNMSQYNASGVTQGYGVGADGGSDDGSGNMAHGGTVRRMAAGGIGNLAQHGGFVGSYAAGGRMLRGPGDGLSDNIPAVIGRKQPARLADGEFVVSADVVSALGGGSTEAGSKKLYSMMDRIRKAAHGTKKQVKPVKERKVLPA